MTRTAVGKAHYKEGSLTHFTAIDDSSHEQTCQAIPTLRERLHHLFDKKTYQEQQEDELNPDITLHKQVIEVALKCENCVHAVIGQNKIQCKLSGANLRVNQS